MFAAIAIFDKIFDIPSDVLLNVFWFGLAKCINASVDFIFIFYVGLGK